MHLVVPGLQCLAEEMGRISIFHALGSKTQLSKQVCLLPTLKSLALSSASCRGGCTEAKRFLKKQSLAERSFQTHVDALYRDVSLVTDKFLGWDKRGDSLFCLDSGGVGVGGELVASSVCHTRTLAITHCSSPSNDPSQRLCCRQHCVCCDHGPLFTLQFPVAMSTVRGCVCARQELEMAAARSRRGQLCSLWAQEKPHLEKQWDIPGGCVKLLCFAGKSFLFLAQRHPVHMSVVIYR